MGLVRKTDLMLDPPKKPRKKHKVTPIVGEFGRYTVDSHSMSARGKEGNYIVDVLAQEETNQGTVTGTCPCKGWQVRKTCSHLEDAREEHEKVAGAQQAEEMGFDDVSKAIRKSEEGEAFG